MNMNESKKIHQGRRNFLKATAVTGAVIAGSSVMADFQPWVNYDKESEDVRIAAKDAGSEDVMKTIIQYGILAASGHNTQPWQFAIENNGIRILPDLSRSLPIVDPMHRELWMSLGCALENMKIAAGSLGFNCDIEYPSSSNESIFLKLETSNVTTNDLLSSDLLSSIPSRQQNRGVFDDRRVDESILSEIRSVDLDVIQGIDIFTYRNSMNEIRQFVYDGNFAQYSNPAFVDELINWLRFNKRSAMAKKDGLFSRCSGNPEVPTWLGKIFVKRMKPERQAESDDIKMKQSAGYLVLSTKEDSLAAWVKAGQVYERIALMMTKHGVSSSMMNQPFEVEELRVKFAKSIDLFGEQPQLLVRFGYGELLAKSLRRDFMDMLI